MSVQLLDLSPQLEEAKEAIESAIERVLQSNGFILGPEVAALEGELARLCECGHSIGVSSGTDSLLASLMALGVGPGDEVITTPYTFFATAEVIARLGARCVFVDIEPHTFNIDPNKVEATITANTKAIMPVHLFGQPAAMDALMAIADRHQIPVVEDAAQAIGAKFQGRTVGSFGRFGCFSFFPSKNLSCMGDGGLVTTSDPEAAAIIRALRTHGATDRTTFGRIGGNFRLDALQAAILHAKLPHLERWNQARAANAKRYGDAFRQRTLSHPDLAPGKPSAAAKTVPNDEHPVVLPVALPDVVHVWNQFVIRVQRRDELMKHLKAKGIGCAVYYPVPMHLQPCLEGLGYQRGDFPEAERAAGESLAIPVFPHLKESQAGEVVDTIAQFYGRP